MNKRKEAFIRKAIEKSVGENLDFSKVVYINNRTKVCIIDHELMEDGNEYGEFLVSPSNFLKGCRHPLKRGKRISESKRFSLERLLERFKETHSEDDMLDYSKVEYKGIDVPVLIICHKKRKDGSEYGDFWQTPRVHLKGCSHPELAIDINSEKQRKSFVDFVLKCESVHQGKGYDYSLVKYVNNRTNVDIICPKHGVFSITPDNLYHGKGCPKCGKSLSKTEDEICTFVKEIVGSDGVVVRDRSVIKNMELDIYVPKHKVAFEYNGILWHSEEYGKDSEYHLRKTTECENKGIRLVHIFEDIYQNRKGQFKNYITMLFYQRYPWENALVKEIRKDYAKQYIERNSVEGYRKSSLCYGAFVGDVMVGSLCLLKTRKGYMISCFCGDIHRLMKYVLETYNDESVYVRLDRTLYSAIDNPFTDFDAVSRSFIPCTKRTVPKSLKSLRSDLNGVSVNVWNCGYIEYVFQ